MAVFQRRTILAFLLIVCTIIAALQLGAARPLGVENGGIILQSLQKGPVTPSGPNPCGYIPGQSSGTCKFTVMNVAGNVVRAKPPAFPNAVADFAAASVVNETRDQSS